MLVPHVFEEVRCDFAVCVTVVVAFLLFIYYWLAIQVFNAEKPKLFHLICRL